MTELGNQSKCGLHCKCARPRSFHAIRPNIRRIHKETWQTAKTIKRQKWKINAEPYYISL